MSTHTPGPWTTNDVAGCGYALRVNKPDGYAICEIWTGNLVDARLIAAAPDMLAALKRAISSHWLSIDFEHNRTKEAGDIRATICAAIARAEGVS